MQAILGSTFNGEGYDGIHFIEGRRCSTCEHHLQPFNGKAHIAYIPIMIIGIQNSPNSQKFPSGVTKSERITKNIADDLENYSHHWAVQ